ncbi:MAG: nickel pincer cofactor biosynthesis protein LarC [Bacillota bacterium]|nr:nickel pincer cofactor biosynthesis protein LarC [Bacillota bacterium]
MKTLYIECNMGAAGDMLTAALLEIAENKEEIIKKLNESGIPGVRFQYEKSVKCGITGSYMKVLVNGIEETSVDAEKHNHPHDHYREHHHEHPHEHSHEHQHNHHKEHSHASMKDVNEIISNANIPGSVKKHAEAVYEIIAAAESQVHGVPVEQIHFHEVGNMDAIADIVAVSFILNEIGADRIIVSPINTGKGQVKCQHGIIPVPAPATALILQEIPAYNNHVKGELCTPTGAALLKYFADEFGSMPIMKVNKTGYGMGTKDFEEANCVRVFYGEQEEKESTNIIELNFNVDDMTGEEIGFATELLFNSGAFEVFVTPVIMKKSRPGHLFTIICSKENKIEIVEKIFKYTTTIGIRESEHPRYVLRRSIETRESEYGSIRCKISQGYGVRKSKYEYDDLAAAAQENDITMEEVRKSIKE